jgi:hypothetical protein
MPSTNLLTLTKEHSYGKELTIISPNFKHQLKSNQPYMQSIKIFSKASLLSRPNTAKLIMSQYISIYCDENCLCTLCAMPYST